MQQLDLRVASVGVGRVRRARIRRSRLTLHAREQRTEQQDRSGVVFVGLCYYLHLLLLDHVRRSVRCDCQRLRALCRFLLACIAQS